MILSKFNKAKCIKCTYSINLGDTSYVFCNYAQSTKSTCIYRDGKTIKDKRGDDYNNCLLYNKKGR